MASSDDELMRQIQKKDEQAFDALFVRHKSQMQYHIQHIVRRVSVAEDLVQEVFLRVWNRADQWRGDGSAKAWVFRMATNMAISHLRKAQTVRERPLEIPDDLMGDEDDNNKPPEWFVQAVSQGADIEFEHAEQVEIVKGLVEDLPEEKREVFRLIYESELEIREAAERLGVPEGTVKSRLFNGRQQVARQWRKLEQEDLE